MEDVAPKLLSKIQEDFQKQFNESEIISSLYAKVRDGTATYKEANEFAIETGEILAKAYGKYLSSDKLPNGKMYYNIAQRILNPTMRNNHHLITEVTGQVQKSLNNAAGIGIKPIKPELNQDRIQGIVNRISSEDIFDDIKWMLGEPVVNFSQSIVDDSIRVNAEFHAKAGMKPKIVRKIAGNCCDWCKSLAGTYSYPVVPKDVYRRHQRCKCTVDYVPGDGKVQNVHTKQWGDEETILMIRRKKGLNEDVRYQISKGQNVTLEYTQNKYPGQGKITIDEEYEMERHKEEIEVAKWLHKNIGGDIKVLNESSEDGVKMPDYIWRNKYWELKTTTTEKSANSAIRKGIKQIAGNPGGIILNYNTEVDIQETIEVIEKRMKGSKPEDILLDIMIVKKAKLMVVIRY